MTLTLPTLCNLFYFLFLLFLLLLLLEIERSTLLWRHWLWACSICELRIEENHSAVHHLQVLCHQRVVFLELINKALHLIWLYLYHEAVTALTVLGRDNQVSSCSQEYLNCKDSSAKILAALIKYFLSLMSPTQHLIAHISVVTGVAPLLVDGLLSQSSLLLYLHINQIYKNILTM